MVGNFAHYDVLQASVMKNKDMSKCDPKIFEKFPKNIVFKFCIPFWLVYENDIVIFHPSMTPFLGGSGLPYNCLPVICLHDFLLVLVV